MESIMKNVRVIVYLRPDQVADIEKIACAMGNSRTVAIRQAVDEYLFRAREDDPELLGAPKLAPRRNRVTP